jgi:hypothetical protein
MTVETPDAPADPAAAEDTRLPAETPPAEPPPAEPPKPQDTDSTKDTKGLDRVVPESYDLKLPEGALLKPEAVAKVAEFAKANQLTQAEAQAVLERENTAIAAYVEEKQKEVETLSTKWVEEVKSDKELGGDNFAKTAEMARRAIDRFAPEIKEDLNRTGLGNHPGFVRFAYRIGKAMADDTFISGNQPPRQPKSIAEVFYGDSAKKNGEDL